MVPPISIPTAKTGTTADTLKTQEEIDKEKPGFIRSVANVAARGGLTAAKGFTALGENLMFIASEAYDPSKTPEERIAKRKDIENIPSEYELVNMVAVAENVFEPLREWVGGPIKINSFFRSAELNKAIGGSSKS